MDTKLSPCLCGTQVEIKEVGTSHHFIECKSCKASTGFRPSVEEATVTWERLVNYRAIVLTSNQIDDMAFGYVPSGKIGELREFADALLQTFKDKLGCGPASANAADMRNAILEEAAKACEARMKNPDPATWGMSEDAAYDAEDMACAEAIRKLKTTPAKAKKGKA